MARCLTCPLGNQLSADKVLAAILDLGGEDYKSVI